MVIDYRAVVECFESFTFLGVHTTKDLTGATHTCTVVKRARWHHCLGRKLKRLGMGPQILKSSTAAPSRAS
jgi:hypothetical protein